jgi:PhnB protein
MAIINPSINFNGNAEEAFNFYKLVFGGKFGKIIRFKDMPNDPENPMPDTEGNKIMNITLPIGPNVLIGNDVPSFMGTVNENENRSKISIQADTKEEANHIYNHLSDGGTIEFPLEESPWGSYFAMFRDKYGIEWMIDFDPNNI